MHPSMYHILRYLPRQLLSCAVKMHIRRRKRKLAHIRTPLSIILYVTSRCNLRCSHCFYWNSLNNSGDDIALADYKKLALSLDHPIALSLTGGEPMLRKDLAELVGCFTALRKVKELSMATNGYFTAATADFCSAFTADNPGLPLSVQVSLDGMAATHDSIRGIAGSFNRAMTTLARLQELEALKPWFSVSAGIAVQKRNVGDMPALIGLLASCGVKIRFNLIRGESSGTFGVASESSSHIEPKDGSDIALDIDEVHLLYDFLIKENTQYGFWTKRHQRIFEIGMRTMETKKRQMDCYAGRIDAVVYANGDVSLCELTKPVGNLHDYDFDLRELWSGEAAGVMRAKARKCFCTHGCNLSTSLMFEPDIAMECVEQKLAALRRGKSN